MSLLAKIKRDQIDARKIGEKVRATILTTLYSEAANVGLNDGKRESTDQEVIAVIKKFANNLRESIAARPSQDLETELIIIENYLPAQLSEEELTTVIERYIGMIDNPDQKDMGKVMGQLKANHGGLFDGKVASQITKRLLS